VIIGNVDLAMANGGFTPIQSWSKQLNISCFRGPLLTGYY